MTVRSGVAPMTLVPKAKCGVIIADYFPSYARAIRAYKGEGVTVVKDAGAWLRVYIRRDKGVSEGYIPSSFVQVSPTVRSRVTAEQCRRKRRAPNFS